MMLERSTHVLAAFSLMVAFGTAAKAQQAAPAGPFVVPDERWGTRTAPILLLSRPDVRADLGLSAEQAASAEPAIADCHSRALSLAGRTGDAVVQTRKAIDDSQARWFEEHLSINQRVRLLQIDLQWEGPSAIVSRPKVADTLGLSASQVEITKRAVKKARVARETPEYTQEDEQKLRKLILAPLSIEQQDRWAAILGPKFTTQPVAPKGTPAAK